MAENYDKGITVKVEVQRLNSSEVEENELSEMVFMHVLDEQPWTSKQADEGDWNILGTYKACRTCDICFKLYKTKKSLEAHSKLKHPVGEEDVRCIVCDKECASFLSLKHHFRYKHKHQFKHQCGKCDGWFHTKEKLNRHANNCVGCKPICVVCGKAFDTQAGMRQHFTIKHGQTYKHVCDYCRREFTNSRGLNSHLNAVHRN